MSSLSLQSTIGKDTPQKNQVKNQLPKTQVRPGRRSRERVVEAGGSGGKVGGVVLIRCGESLVITGLFVCCNRGLGLGPRMQQKANEGFA